MSRIVVNKAQRGVVGACMLAVMIFAIIAVITPSQNNVVDTNNSVKIYPLPEVAIDQASNNKVNDIALLNMEEAFKVAMAFTYRNYADKTKAVALDRKDIKQAKLAAEIFDLQEQNDFKSANAKLKKLNNKELRGHVLAARYLSQGYKTSFGELQGWLSHYADYPQAAQLYKLAQSRRGNSKVHLNKPVSRKLLSGNLATAKYQGKIYQTRQKRSQAETKQYLNLKHMVRDHIQTTEPTQALNKINADAAQRIMDDVEYDRLRADVASGYLYSGRNNHALRLASASLKRSGDKAPIAGWVKGLVLWQKENYKASAKAFEVTAKSAYSSAWLKTASAYWASRAHSRLGNKKQVRHWMEKASAYPRTFYGVMATYILDRPKNYNWKIPNFSRHHAKVLTQNTIGNRAYMLVLSGRNDLAESELLRLDAGKNYKLREALLAFANHYSLAAVSFRMANAWKPADHDVYDAALYPDTGWQPYSGFKVDRALVNAVIRQESKFQHAAKNPSGATGLMQVMPRTAKYISSKETGVVEQALGYLHHPSVNMEFGQSYLKYLLNHRAVGQDMFSLLMAYNAGPGNLSKWKRERANIDDPLLFIETVPFHETRAFVDRVMANYWLYRQRFDQDVPSLEQVASGEWPRYVAQDSDVSKLAMALGFTQ